MIRRRTGPRLDPMTNTAGCHQSDHAEGRLDPVPYRRLWVTRTGTDGFLHRHPIGCPDTTRSAIRWVFSPGWTNVFPGVHSTLTARLPGHLEGWMGTVAVLAALSCIYGRRKGRDPLSVR